MWNAVLNVGDLHSVKFATDAEATAPDPDHPCVAHAAVGGRS
jgi:hypothetical protein